MTHPPSATLQHGPGKRCPVCGRAVWNGGVGAICLACHLKAALDDPGKPAGGTSEAATPAAVPSGSNYFGDYEIVRELGRGGMGIVHEARPFGMRRSVALKLLVAGALASREAIHRFHTEAQAAALLEHPNIVPIYEVGLHEGQYFLAMRYLPGGTLSDLVRHGPLPARRAAEIVRSIARAVHHAHTRGVLHRDLKPGNILLDEAGQPFVADFGLARITAVDERLTLSTALVGTAAYLPPEQVRDGPNAGTMAGDIYGLGAILYELLAGRPPFTGATLAEVLRQVQEEEPSAPGSARLATVRRQKSEGLSDIETICLRCLEKDPAKRYPTAQALADDLERFLTDEPILARPVTRLERAVRWCRRKPALASAALVILILLLLVIVGSPIALYRINEARRAEAIARDRAETEANSALAILGFLKEDLLVLADPYRSAESQLKPNRDLSLRAAIEDAALRIGGRFEHQPSVEADLRLIIGRALERLGELDAAGLQLKQAADLYVKHHGPDSLGALAAEEGLAWVAFRMGEFDQACAAHERVLNRRRAMLPPGSPEIYQSINALATSLAADPAKYAAAAGLLEGVIGEATRLHGAAHPVVLTAKQSLSDIYYQKGPWDEAIRLRHEVAEAITAALGPEHPDAIRAMAGRVFDLRYHAGDYRAAESLSDEILPRARRVLGDHSEPVRLLLRELNHRNQMSGRWRMAIEGQHQLLNQIRRRHSAADPETLWAEDVLGDALQAFGDFAEAERIHRRSAGIRLQTGQTRTIADQRSLRYLGWALCHQGRFEEAEECVREVIRQNLTTFGGTNVRRIYNAGPLVRILAGQGEWQEVAALYAELGKASLDNPSSHQPFGPLHVPAGSLAAEISGQFDLSDQLSAAVLAFAHNSTQRLVRDHTSDFLLMLPPERLRSEDRERLETLAHEAATAAEDPLRRASIAGALAHRKGGYSDAAASLEPLVLNPDNLIAARAGFLLAMTLRAQGSISDGALALERANARLQVALRPGLLGHTGQQDFGYDLRWANYAACLLVRDEAETSLLGRVRSDRVDALWLASARGSWASTQSLLDEAENQARHRNWREARDAYIRAMESGPLNWDPRGTLILQLPLKVGVIFALTGERDGYRSLCHELLEHAAETQAYYASAALLMPEALDPALLDQTLRILRREAASLSEEPASRPQDDWLRLNLAIAEAQAGNTQEASSALAKARGAFNLNAAGIAFAWSGILAARQGNDREAGQLLAKALQLRQKIADGNPDPLSQHWHEVACFDLVLARSQGSPEAQTSPPNRPTNTNDSRVNNKDP